MQILWLNSGDCGAISWVVDEVSHVQQIEVAQNFRLYHL